MSALEELNASTAGHTSGPWRRWQHGEGPRNSGVETTWAYEGDEPLQITDWCLPADAELIAAAPKLLAALEAVMELANREPRFRPRMYGGEYFPIEVAADEIIAAIEEALA